jgi:hypothetical protein
MHNPFQLKTLKTIILTVVLLELFLGGTGRLTEITPFLTLRMILYVIYLVVIVIYFIFNRKLPIEVMALTLFFILVSSISLFNGYLSGATGADIFEDIKPLLNTFLLAYLAFSVATESDIRYILKLRKISALILAAFHIIVCYLVLKYHDMAMLFEALNPEDSLNTNFIFKGEYGFVNYPGDIYLAIGFIVWEQYHRKSWLKYTALIVLILSIISTGTRGIIIALAAAYLAKWLFLKLNYRTLLYLLAGAAIFFVVYSQLQGNVGDKEESDRIRYEQIDEVKDRITPISLLVGHGFGIGVPVRPTHMEISYLEVFHKQGILGLAYYLAILVVTYLAYKRCSYENGAGFYMFVIFIFVLSFTNPYVNHPLGITVMAISIVSMLRIGKLEQHQKVILYKTE